MPASVIYKTLKREGGSWLITADHGNAETMMSPITKGPHVPHPKSGAVYLYEQREGELQAERGPLPGVGAHANGYSGSGPADADERRRSSRLGNERSISRQHLAVAVRRVQIAHDPPGISNPVSRHYFNFEVFRGS